MPVYEYRCSKCGNVFERIQKFSDAPLTVHDDCGGPLEKLISRSAFALKGSGWYATDYAKGSSSKPSGSSESKSEGSPETKSESKPSEGTSSESKSSESKPAESKPVSTTTKSD